MTLYPGRWRALLVPLCAPSCTCPSPGKNPHVDGPGWQQRALARYEGHSEGGAEAHAARMREHVKSGGNVGLALPPHVAALDVDTDTDGGDDYSKPLARDAILALCDEHPVQQSGKTDESGRRIGAHVFGLCADRRPYGTHYGRCPVTIRGVGNQVAVAPSLHRSGLRYEWLSELPADPALLPPFDALLFRHVSRTRAPVERRINEGEADWRAKVSAAWLAELADAEVEFEAGRRHEALLWAAWHRIKAGDSDAAALDAVLALAETRCASGGRFGPNATGPDRRALEQEARAIVRSCRRKMEGWAA